MSRAAPAALVMTPASGETGGLRELLGPARAAALAAALDSEAERWASAVAPGRVHHADVPLADATARLLSDHEGPLLVVWPVLARLRPEHASGALGDLDEGADLVIGPVIDGGLYLLALTRPLAELVDVPDAAWFGADAMSSALQAAAGSGLEVGILRAERGLRQPSDVRAALADRLTPKGITTIIGGS